MEEEKCCWILSRRWRGLVGLAGACAGGRCWLASVTNVCLHGAGLPFKKDRWGRGSARLARVSLSNDREQCMQMVFMGSRLDRWPAALLVLKPRCTPGDKPRAEVFHASHTHGRLFILSNQRYVRKPQYRTANAIANSRQAARRLNLQHQCSMFNTACVAARIPDPPPRSSHTSVPDP